MLPINIKLEQYLIYKLCKISYYYLTEVNFYCHKICEYKVFFLVFTHFFVNFLKANMFFQSFFKDDNE